MKHKRGTRTWWVIGGLGLVGIALAIAAVGTPKWKKEKHAPRIVPTAPPPTRQMAVIPPVHELLAESEAVLVGKVKHRESRWEGRRIVTDVDVEVEEALKGSPGGAVQVKTLGGTVDGVGMRVSSEAELLDEERAVLFLRKADDEDAGVPRYAVLGAAAGKLSVQKEGNGEFVVWRRGDAEERVPLQEVRSHLRNLVQRGPRLPAGQ